VLLLFIAVFAGLFRGRQIANEDTVEYSANLPNVAFASKLKYPAEPWLTCVGFQDFGTMDCKLLLHSKGTYYFFPPVRVDVAGKVTGTAYMNLYQVSDSDLLGVHVQQGLDLNDLNVRLP
jgi:hypothetical protein